MSADEASTLHMGGHHWDHLTAELLMLGQALRPHQRQADAVSRCPGWTRTTGWSNAVSQMGPNLPQVDMGYNASLSLWHRHLQAPRAARRVGLVPVLGHILKGKGTHGTVSSHLLKVGLCLLYLCFICKALALCSWNFKVMHVDKEHTLRARTFQQTLKLDTVHVEEGMSCCFWNTVNAWVWTKESSHKKCYIKKQVSIWMVALSMAVKVKDLDENKTHTSMSCESLTISKATKGSEMQALKGRNCR